MPTQFIATLKEMLVQGKDFYAVQNYYLDHVAEIMGKGDTVKDTMLEEVLHQSSRAAVKGEARIAQMLIMRVAEHGFLYGGFLVNGRPASVFYFEEIQTGLLAVVGQGNASVVSRFRCEIRPEPPCDNN